jgi:hypothetical protein
MARYPVATFIVILWDIDATEEILVSDLRDGLRERGINTYLISHILPKSDERALSYQLDRYDAHPSPLTHRLIAEYVVRNIVSID